MWGCSWYVSIRIMESKGSELKESFGALGCLTCKGVKPTEKVIFLVSHLDLPWVGFGSWVDRLGTKLLYRPKMKSWA